jgi:hypothetical protein
MGRSAAAAAPNVPAHAARERYSDKLTHGARIERSDAVATRGTLSVELARHLLVLAAEERELVARSTHEVFLAKELRYIGDSD